MAGQSFSSHNSLQRKIQPEKLNRTAIFLNKFQDISLFIHGDIKILRIGVVLYHFQKDFFFFRRANVIYYMNHIFFVTYKTLECFIISCGYRPVDSAFVVVAAQK